MLLIYSPSVFERVFFVSLRYFWLPWLSQKSECVIVNIIGFLQQYNLFIEGCFRMLLGVECALFFKRNMAKWTWNLVRKSRKDANIYNLIYYSICVIHNVLGRNTCQLKCSIYGTFRWYTNFHCITHHPITRMLICQWIKSIHVLLFFLSKSNETWCIWRILRMIDP